MSDSSAPGSERSPEPSPSRRLPIVLFLLTIATTTGSSLLNADLLELESWIVAFGFSGSLLFVLGVHELGHKFTADRHGVDASWPYFIPVPPVFFPLGTLGAVIRLSSPFPDRDAALRIGVAGPIAGFAAALIVLAIGLSLAPPPMPDYEAGEGVTQLELGEPLAFGWLVSLLLEDPEDGILHPVAFAGWVGLFLTAINLLPIGQLDGGHVARAVLGPRLAGRLSAATCLALLGLGLLGLPGLLDGRVWPGWILWAGIGFFLTRLPYPEATDPDRPLSRSSRVFAAVALILLVLCFHHQPFRLLEPGP